MDKFAVLQLKKKRAREAEAKAKGQVLGDTLHAEKQVMSEADIIQMNKAFGYLDPPTACYAIGKEGKAAVWWIWKNPYKPYYPEPLSDDEDEMDAEVDSDNEEEIARQAELKARKLEEEMRKKVEEEKEEQEQDQEDEFDEDGNLIIKGPSKKQLEAKRLLREAKAAAKAERERIRAEKVLSGTAKVKITCTGCGKRFKVGTKTCTKCFRALPQPDWDELKRIEDEQRVAAEEKIAEDERIKAEKEEARKLRREAQKEEINKRITGFTIFRYRKDPTHGVERGHNASRGGGGGSVRSGGTRSSMAQGSPNKKKRAALASGHDGPRHHSHNDESDPAGVSLYSYVDPVIPHYNDDDVEADELGVWRKKGSAFFEFKQDSNEKLQTVLVDLPNNYEYRFTVAAVCGNGTGRESAPSNTVMVEEPLPTGWNRFFDEQQKKFYYANLRCNLSAWTRPDSDRYFLEESILLLFNNAEITYLKSLYDEEVEHFKMVLTDRFIDVLHEIGEKMSKYRVIKLFQGYANDDYKCTEWKVFMDICAHVKRRKMAGGFMAAAASAANVGMMVKQSMAASLLAESENKFGHWVVEYSSVAEREYYRNKVTKQVVWDMPDDIRFFIPAKLEAKLMKVFDYGHIETFKQYYSMLDVDNSGDLSDQEIKRLLNALGIHISEAGLQKLVKTVDLNGNGTIEFDEFCWMMYEMSRTDGEGELAGLQGKIPMAARVTTADPADHPENSEEDADAGTGASGTRLPSEQPADRPTTVPPPSLNLEVLSRNLAANVGGHTVIRDPGDNDNPEMHSGTALTHDTINPLPIDHGFTSHTSARSAGKSTHRSQTEAGNVHVSESGLMVPPRPATAVDSNVAGSMYASDSNHFDGPVGDKSNSEENSGAEEDARALLTPTRKPRETDDRSFDSKATGERSGKSGKSAKSASSQSPHKVVPGQGWAVPASARSQLTQSTMDSGDWGDLVSGKNRGTERSMKIDPSLNKSTAERDDNFGDMVYDLDEEGHNDNGIQCPVCGLASQVYKCKKCYDVGYCSRRCQQDDFAQHRLVCIVKSKQEIQELERANQENEERIARELKEKREEEEREREEAEYDARLEEYEEEGGVLVGPEEEIDPISNEPRKKKYSTREKLNKAVWEYFHPKKAAEKRAYNEKIQKRIDIRRAKRKAQEDELRLRDANSKHGPYCFCGCRAF